MPVKNREEYRPDPDALLERINKSIRGKLTVFLGATAGSGKTYAMLETAHERLHEGIDVAIGWVETHGRQETEKMVEGLPVIPARIIEYNGKSFKEMDIDALLEKKPELVLVDELAHTNIPGSRHVRRFQDVEELLKAGINVYTTLNIQHIESLNDIVAQITGVIVRETVPDYIIEQADNIKLIDIPPEDLIKRLKEGKVYMPGQAERALRKFFREGNINALRELALRFTASRVDKDLNEYMREHHIDGPWPAAGRVMVCISASPFSAQLLRAAHRFAQGLHAELLALHVETSGRRSRMSDKERDRLANNMRLAEELGARTLSVVGSNITEEIVEAARSHNVTAIVVGKPRHSRLWEIMHGSIVDTLIRRSGGIHVYVIQGQAEEQAQIPGIKTAPAATRPQLNWMHCGGGFLMITLVTALCWVLKDEIELVNVALLYQLPVLMSAFWWGRWPSYFTALCGVLAFNFLFVPPIFTFSVSDVRYIWSFAFFFVIAFVTGGRTEHLRAEFALARQREKSTRALYGFSRKIAAVIDLDLIARGLARQAAKTTGRLVIVLLPDAGGKLLVRAGHDPVHDTDDSGHVTFIPGQPLVDSSEAAVATWAFEHGQLAGKSTETLPGAKLLYVPLTTGENTVGVLAVHMTEKRVTPEERRLIDAWAGLAAITIERVRLSEKAREAALLVESDRLRTALFNSISHELRTPLSSIIGSISALLECGEVYTPEARRELLETVKDGAARMERVVTNLLDTARLESGMIRLKIDWCDAEDIVGAALRRLGDVTCNHEMEVAVLPGLPLMKADCVLLEQVLVNLVDNAVKYSPTGSIININVTVVDGLVKFSVLDQGAGIPDEDLPKIFDKFYRVQYPKHVTGTGLGLSICKAIIEAHDGQIWAEKRQEGGTAIRFTIPATAHGGIAPAEAGDRHD